MDAYPAQLKSLRKLKCPQDAHPLLYLSANMEKGKDIVKQVCSASNCMEPIYEQVIEWLYKAKNN